MLDRKQKYLQIAFNRTLEEIAIMINSLPLSNRIIIEAGYPLIKTYGTRAINTIKTLWEQRVLGYSLGTVETPEIKPFQLYKSGYGSPLLDLLLKSIEKRKIEKRREFSDYNPPATLPAKGGAPKKEIAFSPYIVADLKCMDRAFTEVEAAASAGASAATCLGLAPVETMDAFIKRCEEIGIDSMLDMMNIEYPFEVLSKLIKPPQIVMLHRGVDEGEENREKEIPYHEIERIKNVYDDVLIAVAGGETIREVITGVFNDADIIVVWRLFNENPEKIATLANEFLKEVK
jgi:3-keto-L-gulonate-6-phosphate decarboxylase